MAMEQMDLNDILSGVERPVVTPKAEVPATPAAAATADPVASPEKPVIEKPLSRRQAHRDKEQEAQGQVRDPETGQYSSKEQKVEETPAPKPEPKVEAPAPQMSNTEKALLAAAQDERRKRQDIERQLEVLQKAQPAATPQPEKTFFDDPDGTLRSHEQRMYMIALNTRLQTTDAIGRTKHPDYDEKINIFLELAKQTPGLHEKMLGSPDPGEFAWRTGRDHLMLKEAGDIDTLKAKIEKETRLKVEQEFKQKQEEEAKKKAAIPGSLSEVSGSNPSKPVWGGPPSLNDILSK